MLRWIAGVVLRKEALGMGDVLLFAALGSWVGPLSLPNVALIASCCGLIYAVITKRGSTTLPFGPCLSLGGIATIYLQALF
ncbi:prepilin peptidase [Escherichia coli]